MCMILRHPDQDPKRAEQFLQELKEPCLSSSYLQIRAAYSLIKGSMIQEPNSAKNAIGAVFSFSVEHSLSQMRVISLGLLTARFVQTIPTDKIDSMGKMLYTEATKANDDVWAVIGGGVTAEMYKRKNNLEKAAIQHLNTENYQAKVDELLRGGELLEDMNR
ncbi:hypothetical protein NEOLI_002397 [Neolecta irregularis DAH-3]|uniref:Uncharacterized protein n=1 Tax=Neolecta irregularis (strain DAH-3) TaxID=1198029 RepID=A0A1U7LK23_NEOID|nr:hypothetical protein NEOLI_002397 [Neolecta irregularis DAH-3]|eukprot:OLL22871.1 hypothetical protein NEOLI_002397 [Neolecta irregularis DAH-3]